MKLIFTIGERNNQLRAPLKNYAILTGKELYTVFLVKKWGIKNHLKLLKQ